MAAPANHLLSAAELANAATQLPDWLIGERLSKRFVFADFPTALAFMVRAGFEAERLCHHPNWTNVYNRVDVEISSHDLGGVSALCVELARALDRAS
jgi:4a-hydroxytetrahydrobiopterin dehydratase